jgi:hypothetical protein
MPILENSQHEWFAQHVASGKNATVAYRLVYGSGTKESAQAASSRLLRNVMVKDRVFELQTELADAEQITRGQIVRHHLTIFNTALDELSESHPLAAKIRKERVVRGRGDDAEDWEVQEIHALNKTESLKEIAKLCGFYEPEKHEHTVKGTSAATLREFHERRKAKKRA